MRFANHTPLPAILIPNAEEDDRMTSLFLAAQTCRIEGSRLVLASAQRPLLLDPSLPYPHDGMLRKATASVCATGFVYPREGRAREALTTLRVGERDAAILALGPRLWQRGAAGGLSASAPVPFDRVEMDWQHAFGGTEDEPARVVDMDGEEAFLPAHESGSPFNLEGKGFHTEAARAVGQPLPQLEDPAQRIQRWDDRPEPVCFAPYPLWGGLRSTYVWHDGQLDPGGASKLGSRAAPRTTFEALPSGTRIALAGMRPGGEALVFEVPPPPVAVDVAVGARVERVLPHLDAIDIDAEAGEVRLLWRAEAIYELIQYELRRARLVATSEFPPA
ncbi:DUF2169 domain-containing protein [Chondromyces apiculatus]|uniref:DUF2169 domain-containing protein n=1 Tax=Chondromyces apiculatus DSM 436 TaxID=1192034 RepID=A0A017T083_9BACT|nr:DUF2169 domain-containing protein [Chondromyces apiculatus]EYF02270.1 Hypothetical protein CAP_7342 [Chondromyces apiculatus DSM 436]